MPQCGEDEHMVAGLISIYWASKNPLRSIYFEAPVLVTGASLFMPPLTLDLAIR
jgi:hypothetical protein